MGKVQISEFDPVKGRAYLVDSTFAYAENLAGHRLDHRRVYRIINNIIYVRETYTVDCIECQYEFGGSAGCKKCGYTKKERYVHFHPISSMEGLVPSPF